MALQYTFTSATGITSSSAYHKVYKIEYNTKLSEATAFAEVFHDASARNNSKVPIDVVEFKFTMAVGDKDDNPVKQAYAAMKTKTSVRDSRGKPISLDYTSKNVQDV
tara:strand:- start:348 stop:668 length:321 start_codon:yes stop_codon:yes gene_type:complete